MTHSHRVGILDSNLHKISDSNPLPVKTVKNGHTCSYNSTSTVLAADETFTGTAGDLLDYGVLIVGLYSDVPSATNGLKFDFSPDGTTWYNTDEYTYLDNGVTKVYTMTPVFRYYRIRYTNGDADQTVFNLQTVIKKTYIKHSSHRIQDNIVDEDDGTLNISVLKLRTARDVYTSGSATNSGNFKISLEELESGISSNSNTQLNTSLFDPETGKGANVESLGSQKTVTPTRLAGTAFSNGTKDPNFWTETVTGTGSVAQSGEITLCTGETANSSARYQSVRKARKVTGAANQFRAVARNQEEVYADCIRRIGPYDGTEGVDGNGFFMQFDGTTFGVGSRKDGVDTVVTNGNFNGNAGDTIDISGTSFIRTVIEYTAKTAKFFIDGTLIHTITATTSALTNSLDLKITMEIINENDNTTDGCFEVLFATILRLGDLETENQYRYITGATTTVCKYGAGRIERLVNSDSTSGKTITIYDGVSAAGTTIAVIDAGTVVGNIELGVPFNDGLTIVTNSSSADVTVVYE